MEAGSLLGESLAEAPRRFLVTIFADLRPGINERLPWPSPARLRRLDWANIFAVLWTEDMARASPNSHIHELSSLQVRVSYTGLNQTSDW